MLPKLVLGTWNVTFLVGKEPELVWEVERYLLDIFGLTSIHSTGSGNNLLKRGWTPSHSGVALGERWSAGVGLLIAPHFGDCAPEFPPVNERVASLILLVREWALNIEHQRPVQSTRPFWNPWVGFWKVFPLWILFFYWGNSHMDNDSKTWREDDWEEQPAISEPEWYFVFGLLY